MIVAINPFRHFLEDGNPLEWKIVQNQRHDAGAGLGVPCGEDPQSEFHGKIDLGNIAVMGQSCGGLQAIETSPSPQVATSVFSTARS
ncbi:MAG: hypothetical protein R2751_18940 [Bacteroidales bacterium]